MQSHWTSNNIDLKNGYLHYTRTGHGEKPPLVLVHGFSDNGLCWAKTAQKLDDKYDITMPDSRGHGLSARVQSGDAVDNAGDLAELIQSLNLQNPIIAGHSMGASSASELGARFPDLPRALILEDPPWGMRRPARNQQEGQSGSSVLDWAKSLKGKSLDEVLAENVHEHPSWESAVLRAWCIGKTQLDQKFLSLQSLTWMDWQEVVQGIECPTLLITANQPGGIVSEETANLALSMNERVMRVHISGTGHHIRFENYDDYYAAFIAFLDKVSNIERS